MRPSARRHAHRLARSPVVLVRPRYPENLGAVARAMRVTGFHELVLVAPHPLATPSHDQARKLAVGSEDLLESARQLPTLHDVIGSVDVTAATTARRGISGVLTPRQLARRMIQQGAEGRRVALVFGGERAGLRRAEVDDCDLVCRIPMVANEPSLNLAQAVMIVLYELMVTALEPADADSPPSGRLIRE